MTPRVTSAMANEPDPDENIFAAALQWDDPAERAAYLDEACAGRPDLRARVEALLRASSEAQTFLERPVGIPRPAPDALAPTVKLGFSDMLPAAEGPGTKIGRYKLLQQIGEGGCGTVFMAEQEEPVRRRVALKVIKLGMDTKSVVARFEAERQALAMMDHPNIAKVLDAGATDSGRPFFVMELVRGIPITRYCDENKLDTQQRLDLFIKVCQAIQHAHQKGIIHRDIKPSNILVTLHDGVPIPKVIDFGIAKATEGRLTDRTLFTAFEQFIGTPAYMSPEQAEMSGLDIDTRSDIYALGVLLYELLTGKTPFDAKELVQSGLDAMRKTIREKEPIRPSTRLTQALVAAEVTRRTSGSVEESASSRRRLQEVVHQLKGDLDWIVMKCLEKDRTRRYETANGIAADIHRHLESEPVVARPPSTMYRLQKAWRRNRLVWSAASTGVGLLLAGLIATNAGWSQARRATREAEQDRNQANLAKATAEASAIQLRESAYAAEMRAAQIALNAGNLGECRRLLLRQRPGPSQTDLRGLEWRLLWRQSASDFSKVFDVSSPVVDAIPIPGSPWIVTTSLDRQVRVWDAERRTSSQVLGTSRSTDYIQEVASLSLDGSQLAVAHEDSVRIYRTADWKVVQEFRTPASTVAFAPEGLEVYARSRSELQRLDLGNGSVTSILRWQDESAEHGYRRIVLSRDGRFLCSSSRESSTVEVRDRSNPNLLLFTGEAPHVISLCCSPDGQWLAAGSWDGKIRIWNLRERRLVRRLEAGTLLCLGLTFSPDSRELAVGGNDQKIRIWRQIDSGSGPDWKVHRELQGPNNEIWRIRLSQTEPRMIVTSKDGLVYATSARTIPPRVVRFIPEPKTPSFVVWVADPRTGILWNLHSRSRVRGFDFRTGSEVREAHHPSVPSDSLQCCDDGRVWSVSQRGTLVIWADGRIEQDIQLPDASRILGIRAPFRIRDDWFVAARTDTNSSFGRLLRVGRRRGDVSQVPGEFPFSEEWDGRYVAGAPTADLGVRWNKHGATSRPSPTQYALSQFSIPATTQQHLLSGHRWSLYQACFSPDSSLLASGSSDGTALLWNLKTGRPIANPLTSHRSGVHGVQFSHDGRTLISSGDDSTVRFSHVRTGLEMLVLDSCMFDWPLRRALLEGVDDGMLLVESASGGIPDHTQFAWWPTPSTSEIYNEIDRMRSHDGD